MTTPTTPLSYQMSREKIREALQEAKEALRGFKERGMSMGASHPHLANYIAYPEDVWGKMRDTLKDIDAALALLDAEAPSYSMSRDYEALHEHIRAGVNALGYVDYDTLGAEYPARIPCGITMRSGYWVFDHYELWKQGQIKADFLAECQRLNLEWISPVAPAKTVEGIDEGHPGYRAVLIAALSMEEKDIVRLVKDCSMVIPKPSPVSGPKKGAG